ncbi:transcriptional regulator NrdR [Canibacter sp. lx-72]|uniref:transcriptional regulator NrdR n=1 Tax=Canibacter zhuwentaonis TaxID=2837491 RepID=UPI001BDD51EF|nr:transcriptional regulator NrdR [Canibacter zhuwentaonis]MBT1017858.1 transcriptional regulator NrdR [Canibacter zhuwentaonis]MBT1035021.1 transcriptional regulator NrdR [Canibacter zhuwentaonis]
MQCPFCSSIESKVIDSRGTEESRAIRRRRECPDCKKRFSTTETIVLNVVKRGGFVEQFSREKVVSGVRKACQGRPVGDTELAILAQRVEDSLKALGNAQIDAIDVGKAVLPFLSKLDRVAYLRFASVYENFDSLEDFEAAILKLRNDDNEGN